MAKSLTYMFISGLCFGHGFIIRPEKPTIKATVDKSQILIGEPVRFSIDVKSPMVSGNLLPQFDSLPILR
jgi:hypothetical protein